MYRGHWQSKFVHFHNTSQNFGILADETGTRITTPDSLHHSKQRTVSLDHLAYGTTRMPCKLPKADGTGSLGITNILIYIDHVLIHTDTHEKHLEALEQVLMRLHQHHLKINLDKCLFGDKKVSYLGFTLTPEGIKSGEAKLKAIKSAAPPGNVKAILSFVGLCNFFGNHIQGFAITAAPLFKLTRQDS